MASKAVVSGPMRAARSSWSAPAWHAGAQDTTRRVDAGLLDQDQAQEVSVYDIAELKLVAARQEWSSWGQEVLIDQERIDRFAKATGDYSWLHVDATRCKSDSPSGKTVAHGFLTLSLIASMTPPRKNAAVRIREPCTRINYGGDKLRFIRAVPVGSRIVLRERLVAARPGRNNNPILTFEAQVAIQGQETRPVMSYFFHVYYVPTHGSASHLPSKL